MDINIRDHIINNFKGDNYDQLRSAIEESIQEGDEVTLPGMGVLLELIWEGADQELKNKMLDVIKTQVEERSKNTTTNEPEN